MGLDECEVDVVSRLASGVDVRLPASAHAAGLRCYRHVGPMAVNVHQLPRSHLWDRHLRGTTPRHGRGVVVEVVKRELTARGRLLLPPDYLLCILSSALDPVERLSGTTPPGMCTIMLPMTKLFLLMVVSFGWAVGFRFRMVLRLKRGKDAPRFSPAGRQPLFTSARSNPHNPHPPPFPRHSPHTFTSHQHAL